MMTSKKIIGTLRRPLAEILQDLEQPIPSEMLEQKPTYHRESKTGEVSYVPWYNCIQLLMRYCPGYDFEIRTQSFGERIIVEGRLTIRAKEGDFVYESLGVAHSEDRNYEEAVYEAEESALRRCMAKLGCGLELWDKQETSALPPPTHEVRKVSQAQLSRLYAIVNELGLSKEEAKAIIHSQGYASSKDIIFEDYERVIQEIRKAKSPVYLKWKDENDALAWALEQLPTIGMAQITQEWRLLVPSHGKKAPAWVERVKELKSLSQNSMRTSEQKII